MYKDPLYEYEQELLRKQIHKNSFFGGIFRTIKVVFLYFFLSWTIFSVLMGALNFSAYSARILHWIDPSTLENIKNELQTVVAQSSMEVHASEANAEEQQDSATVLSEKIATIDPSMIYSRSYTAERLLGNISENWGTATFQVTPYENRIIIPKIGKNVPLLDVSHHQDEDPEKLEDTFMEELKSGVVRYPGTAQPGEMGNVFIFWHSSNYPWIQSQYNDVFALLDQLDAGDEIIIFYNQKKFVYHITDKSIVKPGDVKTLGSRDPNKKEISLMTCWPVGTTLERIIVFGQLEESHS